MEGEGECSELPVIKVLDNTAFFPVYRQIAMDLVGKELSYNVVRICIIASLGFNKEPFILIMVFKFVPQILIFSPVEQPKTTDLVIDIIL